MSDDLVMRLRDCPDMDAVDEAADAIEAQAARIAELEAAVEDALKYVWRGDWNKLKPETQKALKK